MKGNGRSSSEADLLREQLLSVCLWAAIDDSSDVMVNALQGN